MRISDWSSDVCSSDLNCNNDGKTQAGQDCSRPWDISNAGNQNRALADPAPGIIPSVIQGIPITPWIAIVSSLQRSTGIINIKRDEEADGYERMRLGGIAGRVLYSGLGVGLMIAGGTAQTVTASATVKPPLSP